jgi:Zn-dependent metalloprotease
MHTLYRLLWLICWSFCACGPSSLPPSPMEDVDPLAQLERDTGHRWYARYHADLHTPAFLDGRTAPLAASPQDALREGRAFLYKYAALFGLHDDDVASEGAETDELGMTHARFSQKKNKVPVFGGDLIVHFAADGALVRVNGRITPTSPMPLDSAIDEDHARVAALLDAREVHPDLDAAAFETRKPVLHVLPLSPSDARLAWRVEVEITGAPEPVLYETFVDAHDAGIMRRSNLITTLQGSGTGWFGDTKWLSISHKKSGYYLEAEDRDGLKTYAATAGYRLPGTAVRSATPTAFDLAGDSAGAAVDAHAHLSATWDYFESQHRRRGWDGKGGVVRGTVHYGRALANAFWNGRQVVFGDGDQDNAPFSAALDVVAHEYTHGVIAHTARLLPYGEPGALNEAIADLFGAFVSLGSGHGSDWQIGETVHLSGDRPAPLRDLARPSATRSPMHMSEYHETSDDNGGVHVNSTIVSHAGYLMAEGALGPDLTARIFYRALTRYLTSGSTFADAADATIAAARDLRAAEHRVRDAWVSVGVLR